MKQSRLILISLLSCGFILSACGHTPTSSITPDEEGWLPITYEEIKAAFDNRQQSPYNHREYDYIEMGQTYRIVENLSGSTWIVQQGSEGASPLQWLETQYSIANYESVLDQIEITIGKNEQQHKYRYGVVNEIEGRVMSQHVVVDQYFNYLECLQYTDTTLNGGMRNIVYSTLN